MTVKSKVVSLVVQYPVEITSQPVNTTVLNKNAATLTIEATGNPSPTYQWYKNNTKIDGATNKSISVGTEIANNGDKYYCIVSNTRNAGESHITSNTANLNVQYAPEITTMPINKDGEVGGTVSFAIDATGNPTPSYQWYKQGTAISGATNKEYITDTLTYSDASTIYMCKVSNSIGSVNSDPLTITIYGLPEITSQPQNTTEIS